MAISLNGTNQYLSKATAILSAFPISMAAWVYFTSAAGGACPFSLTNAAATNDLLTWTDFADTPNAFAAEFKKTTAFTAYNSSLAPIPMNTWIHVAAVFSNTTTQISYVNGVNSTATNTSTTIGAMTATGIGASPSTGNSVWWPGLLASIAFWNVALVDGDVASLAAGFSPRKIRPSGLISYVRGDQANGADIISSTLWTANNTPTVSANHPPQFIN